MPTARSGVTGCATCPAIIASFATTPAVAARYPDRVSHLILHGTHAQGMNTGQMERSWFNKLQKTSCTGETAAQLEAAMHDAEVREQAAALRVPVLVTHGSDDVAVPFEQGRLLAGLIPNATFLPLQCANHVMLERDPAWPEFVAGVDRFTGDV